MTTTRRDIDAVLGPRSRSRSRRWAGAIGLLLVLAAAGYAWQRARSPGDAPTAYVTDTVRRADIVVQVAATGSVEPTNLVEISSELSGTVASVAVDFNDTVARGQALAQLDTEKLEATIEHARATLAAREAMVAQTNATRDETRANYERTRQLESKGMVAAEALLSARAAYERARAAVSAAEADVRVAQAALRMNEADLERACICSPIDGIVLERNVEAGQIVAASFQAPVLFTLAEDLAQMELRVDIDEADIGRVSAGDTARFTVEAYQDRDFPASIAELRYAPQTVEGVVTYEAILSVDNDALLLRPGMTATAEITVAEVRDTLAVPNAALRFAPPAAASAPGETDEGEGAAAGGEKRSGLLGMLFSGPPRTEPTAREPEVDASGRRTLWVLRDGAAVPVPVTAGATDGVLTAIVDGDLAAGERVITDIDDTRP